MTYAEQLLAVAEEAATAIRQYADVVVAPATSVHDIDQAWMLVRDAVDALVALSPSSISIALPGTPPHGPRRHPVVWLDVGYAVEVADQQRAAAIARSRASASEAVSVSDEYGDIFDLDAVALVDFLETVDGWKPERYGERVLSLVTTTRSIRQLTRHESEVLRQKIASGDDVSHRPEDH